MSSDGGGCGALFVMGLMGYAAFSGISYLGGTSGCSDYASEFSCWYVKEKAPYDVYYWRNVRDDDPDDNQLVASAVGLHQCRGKAAEFAARIGEPWNERAYICALKKDGRILEKHRLLVQY